MSTARFSLVRSLGPADLLTLLNATLGTASILATLGWAMGGATYLLPLAFLCLPAALLCDVLDGHVARRQGRASVLGRELDSLADVISFGVAPAVLAYGVGLNAPLNLPFLLFLVACGVGRLARFNVTAEQLAGPGGKVRYYEGAPVTTSLLLVAVLAWAALRGAVPLGQLGSGAWAFHPLSLLFGVGGAAMIGKTLRIPKP